MIQYSYHVHVADGTAPLARTRAMPPLPDGIRQWQPPALDRVGETLEASPLLVAAGGLVGAGLSALLVRRLTGGIFKPLLAGVAGAIAGAATTALGYSLRLDDRHERPSPPAGQVQPSLRPAAAEQLKVMTYNVRGGMSPDDYHTTDAELDALAETIRREQPDVLMLQEVDGSTMRSSYRDVLQELADRLHPTSAISASPGTRSTGRNENVAILTFNGVRIDNARNLVHADPLGSGPWRRSRGAFTDLRKALGEVFDKPEWGHGPSYPSYFPRTTLEAIAVTPEGNDIRLLTGHYSGPTSKVDYQAEQTLLLAPALAAWRGPTLWGADFNVASGSHTGRLESDALLGAGLLDSFTSTGVAPGDQARKSGASPASSDIDRIYHSSDFTAALTHVVQEQQMASDHRPVVTTVTLQPAGD